MIEEIEEIITSLEALDITHEDLGVTNGWHDAQGFKKEFGPKLIYFVRVRHWI